MLDLSTAGGHDNQTSHSLSLRRLPPYCHHSGLEPREASCRVTSDRGRPWHLLGFGTAEAALVAAYYCVYTTDDLYH